jgi:integrase
MKRMWTTAFLDCLKPGHPEEADEKVRGLRMRTSGSGTKTAILRYRFGGKQENLKIGVYPALDLKTIRSRAEAARGEIAKGVNPAGEKRIAKEVVKAKAREAAPPDLIEVAAKAYLARYSREKKLRPRTVVELTRLFAHDILPTWRGRRLSPPIPRADGKRLIRDIADRAPIVANRVATALITFGKWCVEEGICDVFPFPGVRKVATEEPRDRTLSPEEIRALMTALKAEEEYPYGSLVRLLLLLGQRRSEIAEMRWSEVNLESGIWTLPKERSKNRAAHALALPKAAIKILRTAPRFEGSDFIFTCAGGEGPVMDFVRIKRRLDQRMEAAIGKPIPRWVFHDLRRSFASGLGEIGIQPHIIEACLNHRSGIVSGISAVYNRFSYQPEMRAALEAWSRRIDAIVAGEDHPVEDERIVERRRDDEGPDPATLGGWAIRRVSRASAF